MSPTLRTTYRACAGALIVAAVGVQYWLTVGGATGAGIAQSSIKFFSFFTILSNILAAAALLIPLVSPRSVPGAFFARPSVRTAIAGYMIMVGVVYYVLLVGLSNRQGWQLFFEHILHAVTPPLFILDWLAFVDKREVDWHIGACALGYPLVYVVWTFAHGAATGWYPYPFLDVAQLGYLHALVNVGALIAVYVVLEAALVAIGRLMPSPAR